jgi:hypothetical protein
VPTSWSGSKSQPGVDWESGTYHEKRRPAKRINRQALDADLARNLWERSEQVISGPLRRVRAGSLSQCAAGRL